jgi:hypothetical protein
MPTFTIGLARTCLVKVEAPSIESALQAANFVGCSDESWKTEREEIGFRILGIELVENDAFDATER